MRLYPSYQSPEKPQDLSAPFSSMLRGHRYVVFHDTLGVPFWLAEESISIAPFRTDRFLLRPPSSPFLAVSSETLSAAKIELFPIRRFSLEMLRL